MNKPKIIPCDHPRNICRCKDFQPAGDDNFCANCACPASYHSAAALRGKIYTRCIGSGMSKRKMRRGAARLLEQSPKRRQKTGMKSGKVKCNPGPKISAQPPRSVDYRAVLLRELKDPEFAVMYLSQVLATDDTDALKLAVGDFVSAWGHPGEKK
jgi:hypothetical protein